MPLSCHILLYTYCVVRGEVKVIANALRQMAGSTKNSFILLFFGVGWGGVAEFCAEGDQRHSQLRSPRKDWIVTDRRERGIWWRKPQTREQEAVITS